jgi:hypothetical protein
VTMIGSAELERAERTLQVVYGGRIDRQLEAFRVDRAAYDNFLAQNWEVLRGRYEESFTKMDPRLEPAFNTIFTHCFFVGMVAGRNQGREIE